jgi:hypothetical protein
MWITRTPGSLETSLKLSGANRAELEKVLEHYNKREGDGLKLRAAKYLISNCYIYSAQSAWFEDDNKKKINFFPPKYRRIDKVRTVRDSLLRNANYVSNITNDCQALRSDYLINHIDTMVSIWQASAWRNKINFDQFCRFILPYRVLNEPQSNWARLLAKKYGAVADSASDIVTVAKAINKALARDIKYNVCWIGGIGLQSVPELFDSKSGMCDDLAVYGVCAMRACGIPSAVDFTIWAKTNMGHSWGVIFDENGAPLSFGPGEQAPGEHKKIFFSLQPYLKLAKVYRRMFEINQSGLWSKVDDLMTIPQFFHQMNIIDVTAEYIPVHDLELPVNGYEKSTGLVYICVYNSGKWAPVHWARVKNGKAIFSKMGDDILYVIGKFEEEEIIPISTPFIFDKDQNVFYLDSKHSIKNSITLNKNIPGIGPLNNKKEHQLLKWCNNKWISIQEIKVQPDNSLTINNLTERTLYKFEGNSRPFTIASDKVVWW